MEGINTNILYEKDTLNCRVPDDIIESILFRLPVKSLLRFKAVSQKWEVTISNPIFARIHLHQSKISSSRQYIFGEEIINDPTEQVCGKFKLIRFENQEFQVESVLDYPQELGDAYFMCYLDGLSLLQCYEVKDPCSDSMDYAEIKYYVLWNPSFATSIMFKYPYLVGFSPMFYGICYDPLIEDYKVVMGDQIHYAVLSCRNKRWTDIQKLPFNGRSYGTDPPGVCFNGSLYWVLNERSTPYNNQNIKFQIVHFDPRDDRFKKLHKPQGIQNGHNPVFLVLLGGHLCLYYLSMVEHLLIMKKYDDRDSWIEFIIIDNMPSMIYPRPLFMTDENEIVLDVNECSENFIVYNLSQKTFIKIKTSMEIESIFFPFVESLMLDTRRNRGYRRPKPFEELREVFFFM